jgi:hypothetical protein
MFFTALCPHDLYKYSLRMIIWKLGLETGGPNASHKNGSEIRILYACMVATRAWTGWSVGMQAVVILGWYEIGSIYLVAYAGR